MYSDDLISVRSRISVAAKISIGLISFFYFISVAGSSLTVRGWMNHDDIYFLRLASSFLSTGWFGAYSQMTLIKGPTYPLFLALNFELGLPLLLTSQLIYIASCLAMAWAISLYRVSSWLVVLIFAALMLHPIAFITEMFVVLRSSLFLSLTIFWCATWTALPQLVLQMRPKLTLLAAIASGFSFAAFWMIREEGVWILPAAFVVPAGYLVLFWYQRRKQFIQRYLAMLSIAGAVFGLLYLAVALRNYQQYQYFGTVDMKAPRYHAAYEALARVRPKEWKPFSPAPAEVRERIYAVSPEFSKIRQAMEGSFWKHYSCNNPRLSYTCEDLNSQTLLWALRDAVASRGYYQNGEKAEAYYMRLAAEVNAACDRHALECDSPGRFLVPPLNGYIVRLWWKLLYTTSLPRMLFLTDLHLGPNPSLAPELFPYVSAFTHSRITPSSAGAGSTYSGDQEAMSHVDGWAYNPAGTLTDVHMETENGQPASSVIKHVRRPDLVTGLKDPKAEFSGFAISYSCVDPCYFVFRTDTGQAVKVPVPRPAKNQPDENKIDSAAIDSSDFSIRYDMFSAKHNIDAQVRITSPDQLLGKFDQTRLSMRNAVTRAYTILLPILLGAGLGAVGLSAFLWWKSHRHPDPAIVILTAFFGAAWSARILIITLFDASFNGTWGEKYDYLSPCFSMWMLFLGCCVLLLFHPKQQSRSRLGNRYWCKFVAYEIPRSD
jgi:hypothetical protein